MTQALFLMVTMVATLARPALAKDPGELVIRNATILTASHGTIENGSVYVRGGKIVGVGPNLSAPATATVIDAGGKYVTPGLIDCHSHIATDGDSNEGSLSVTSMVRIGDVIDPDGVDIFYALSGGVTCANILHGSANAIGGQNAVIKLRRGGRAADLLMAEAPPGIKFALGENPKRSNFRGATSRYPATRMGVEDVIRDAFTRARQYRDEWRRYDEALRRKERNLLPPRRDLELEPLVEVLEGRRLVHCHAYRADEMLMLLRLSKELGFKVATFQHGLEGYRVARECAAAGVGVSTFTDMWGYKIEAYDATPFNAAMMYEHGVLVSINSDDGERMRRLNTDAARAVRYGGVPEEEALRMITLNPARQLGIDKWVGSIDVGKDADLVIWSAHPLSSFAVAERVYVDGELYFDRAKALQAALDAEAERRALIEKAKAAAAREAARDTPEKPPAAPKPPTAGQKEGTPQ
jgi:imidazolonepropionase-like amidohydrolase